MTKYYIHVITHAEIVNVGMNASILFSVFVMLQLAMLTQNSRHRRALCQMCEAPLVKESHAQIDVIWHCVEL